MRHISLTLTLAALLVLALSPAASAQDDGWTDDTLRATVPGLVGWSDLDLPWFVWKDDSSITALNLDTGEIVLVATLSTVGPGWVLIDSGVVIWSDPWTMIYGKDLVSGAEFSIDLGPSPSSVLPALTDRWVVWIQFPPVYAPDQVGTMYAQDIRAMSEPFVVTDHPGEVFDAAGDLVAWAEPSPSDPDGSRIVVHNLASVATVDTIELAGGVYPLDMDGTTLVYARNEPCVTQTEVCFEGPDTIFSVDLETGETWTLSTDVYTHEGGYPITTDGRFIVWESGWPSGTLGYDPWRDAWFFLPIDRHAVELDDGLLVWSQARDAVEGPTEIHAAPAAEFSSGQRSRYFPDTDQWLALGFLTFWDANGGHAVFDAPLSAQGHWRNDIFRTEQWFPRQCFEQYPENAGTPYDILLGLLGSEDADARGLRATPPFQPLAPSGGGDTDHVFFPETGHWLSNAFKSYWESNGLDMGDPGVSYRESVLLFGYPLSEEYTDSETGRIVQYFERALFEWRPENGPPHNVYPHRLGEDHLPEQLR